MIQKKKKFDLSKALNRHNLITRSGIKVYNFRRRPYGSRHTEYNFIADYKGGVLTYTQDGKFSSRKDLHTMDLFLLTYVPQEGDLVLVRDSEDTSWTECIYLYKDKFGNIICVNKVEQDDYLAGKLYSTTTWTKMELACNLSVNVRIEISDKLIDLSEFSEKMLKKIIKQGIKLIK